MFTAYFEHLAPLTCLHKLEVFETVESCEVLPPQFLRGQPLTLRSVLQGSP